MNKSILGKIIPFVAKYRFWFSLASAIIIYLIIVNPVNAADSADRLSGILDLTEQGMRSTEAWWDKLWSDTFDPPGQTGGNISVYSFANPVRFLLAIGIIFWMVDYARKMANSKGMGQSLQIFFDSSLRVLLIILFLTDHGSYSRFLAYGLRDITYSWSEGLMNQQIVDVKLRDAIEGQLLVEGVKNEIRQQGEKCMQLPRPEVALPSATRPPVDNENPLTIEQDQAYRYLECLDKLRTFIEDKRESALEERECGRICRFFVIWTTSVFADLDRGIEAEKKSRIAEYQTQFEDEYHSMVDFFQHFERKGWMGAFAITQWMWITFLEGAMWLSGLFAPLFIALSLIPEKEKMFSVWLIEILTIGLARLAYIALIGVVAVQVSTADPALQASIAQTNTAGANLNTTTETFLLSNDDRFFMAMGLFAPAVSLAVVGTGALAAANSYRSQSVGALVTVTNIATGSIANLAYTYSRYADKRR